MHAIFLSSQALRHGWPQFFCDFGFGGEIWIDQNLIAHDRPGISNNENPSTMWAKYLTLNGGCSKSVMYCDKLDGQTKLSVISDFFQHAFLGPDF